ncbi:reverse transcriptase [Talaromyces pinophilus]|uniref:Reverse transcriptase n=1 Tax=Talaromyces pinophilus TaxID=128442 RepID=A0A478EC33_TALPI|nr:reverse transcriptase [Talaromyces pinophilus]
MATFLRDPHVLRASVIATQELWHNKYNDTTHQPARLTHQLLYPKASNHNGVPTRVALYISKQINPASWTHTVVSPDYQILHIRYSQGEEPWDLYIHNIYNNTKLDTLTTLDQCISQLSTTPTTEHLIVGDINLHHLAWGGASTAIDSQAIALLESIDRHEIELARRKDW